MKIYLDNCCYNRPYDSQEQLLISLETQAKLYIQNEIRNGKIELVTSYMLIFENDSNPYEMRRIPINDFISLFSSEHIGKEDADEVLQIAKKIIKTGIKNKDAIHVASAIKAHCDYFLTTDKRLLKYQTEQIRILNPIDFIKEMEKTHDE